MAESVGVRELRQNASKLLKRVKAGESIDVTEHGRPIARLVPVKPSPLEQMYLDGRITPGKGDLVELSSRLRLPAEPGEKPLSEIVLEMRAEERY